MVVLDTDHISILERRGPEASRLVARLSQIPSTDVHVTIISYEEQIRGWMSAIAGAKTSAAEVSLYARLNAQLENYCDLFVLPYSSEAAARFESLRRAHRRLSASDLKIAAIVLENEATLLSRNMRHFDSIAGLRVDDWTG